MPIFLFVNLDICTRLREKEHIESITEEDKKKQTNKYMRPCKGIKLDAYDVLHAFEVNNPATAHAVKKLLASGQRGYKDTIQDLEEARDSIARAIELEEEE